MEARSARRVPGARSPSPGSPAALHELSSIVGNSAFAALVGAGRAADPEVRSAVEQRLGVDLGDVHVHTGPAAAAAAAAVDARAVTVGRHVVLGAGEPAVGTVGGRRLVAHELVHVAQRRSAPSVRPGWSAPGDPFERHAAAVSEAVTGGRPGGHVPVPTGPAPAASRQERPAGTAPTAPRPTAPQPDADLVLALNVLRTRDPGRFPDIVIRNEFAVYRLLSRYGFHGSWVKPEAYLDDFDRAFARWIQDGHLGLLLTQGTGPLVPIVEPEDNRPILAALPDGTGYVGTPRGFRAAAQAQHAQRALRTLSNISGGLGGAIGYWLGGDAGSDLGANIDSLAGGVAGTVGGRQRMRDVGANLGPVRDTVADVRPLSAPKPSSAGALAPGPPPAAPASRPAPTPGPPAATGPAPVPTLGPPAPVPVRPPSVAPSSAAAASAWRAEWEPLIGKAETPSPRQNDRGFRTQEAVSPDGRTRVVITEGVVGRQVTGKSTADYGTISKGEHSTHPVGRQLGEDTGPSAQGSAPATFNLGPMKSFENGLARSARIAAEQGGTVETRTAMITQLRTVNGKEVPLTVGVQRSAYIRLPGRDPVFLGELKAVVDPDTRTVQVLVETRF